MGQVKAMVLTDGDHGLGRVFHAWTPVYMLYPRDFRHRVVVLLESSALRGGAVAVPRGLGQLDEQQLSADFRRHGGNVILLWDLRREGEVLLSSLFTDRVPPPQPAPHPLCGVSGQSEAYHSEVRDGKGGKVSKRGRSMHVRIRRVRSLRESDVEARGASCVGS